MENKFTLPGYFQPLAQHPTQARRIWAAECTRDIDQYVLFRKQITVPSDGIYDLRIFGDTYYNLHIDGHFLHRGPVRRHEAHAEFDCLQLFLTAGVHTVAVLVHWLGQQCAGHRMAEYAFWCDLTAADSSCIAATDSTWKACFCDAFATDGCIMSHYDYREDVDLRCFPHGWETPEFNDDAWGGARDCGAVGDESDLHRDYCLRSMQLFAYQREDAVITKRGTYAEMLPPEQYYVRRSLERLRDSKITDGTYTVAAFRAVLSGTPVIRYENASAGDELIIGYDDMTNDSGFPMPGRAMEYLDRFTLPAGSGEVRVVMPRGFRYLLIDASGSCSVTAVSAIREEYPYSERKAFVCGDPYFTTLYEQSANTQRICTIDGFTDCVGRERVLWLGDAYLDCLGAYYADADSGLLLTTLYEHAMGLGHLGALGGYNSSDLQPDWLYMPSYNLMYLHMLCDYVLYTGREDDIRPLLPTARAILDFVLANCNERGIFDTDVNDCSNYWDWGYAEPHGESLKTNAYFIMTAERMASMPFFAPIIDDALLARCEQMKTACGEIFYNEARGVYHDGNIFGGARNPLSTQGANAYAVLSGTCPADRRQSVLRTITDPANLNDIPCGENSGNEAFTPDTDKVLPAATMYGAAAVVRALFESGMADAGIDYIREVWGPFADLPTLPELRRNGANNTMCHGWSGAPAFLLHQYLLGLTPAANGWKEARLAPPDTDRITSAKGLIRTLFGELCAQWYRTDGVMHIRAVVPGGMTLNVVWQNRTIPLSAGTHTLYF